MGAAFHSRLLTVFLFVQASDAFLSPSIRALSALRFGSLAYRETVQRPQRFAAPRMQAETYDLVVIGGGPVGITAALTATAAGRTVALIDGTPKNLVPFTGPTGIYSKALRDTALKVDVNTLRTMGLHDNVVWNQVTQQTNGESFRILYDFFRT